MEFSLPGLPEPFDGWGPPVNCDVRSQLLKSFEAEHLEKYPMVKLGKICDFTAQGMRFQEQRVAKGKAKGKGFQPLLVKVEDGDFQLVDSRPVPTKGKGKGGGKAKGKGKVVVNYQEGILGTKQKFAFQQQDKGGQMKGQKGLQKGQKGKKGKGRGPMRSQGPNFKEWSIQTKTEWVMKWEIMMNQLAKVQLDARLVKFEDVKWCGQLYNYNKDFDRIMVRTEKRLTRFEDTNFYNVTTSEDPHLQEIVQEDDSVTLVATDQVLATLIASARSVYSWDLVITKVQGKILIDKRDDASLDTLSVNENAQTTPDPENKDIFNTPLKLGQEAMCINQNFSQTVLDVNDEDSCEAFEPNPFDEDESCERIAYRYRKITLPGNPKDANPIKQKDIALVVRTEISCKMPGSGTYVSAKAFNEYDPKLGLAWRTSLESQGGAVLANELKNNSFKLGRWVAQAMLAGCDQMKLGYISRVDEKNPGSHSVLGVRTHHTKDFAEQIGLTANNAYGILRSIIDNVLTWEDGKYLLLKDPTKSIMRFYDVPWDTFDEEDDEDEDFEEEMNLDEDGNVAPEQPSNPMERTRSA